MPRARWRSWSALRMWRLRRELVTRILFEITDGRQPCGGEAVAGRGAGSETGWSRFLQPRFAMGMAMTILSFAMLGRFAGIDCGS